MSPYSVQESTDQSMSMRKFPDERKNHPKGLKIKVLRIHTGLGVVTELTDFRNSR